MIALTKRTEYAIIAACHLARSGDRIVAARDLAERYQIRVPLLMNVLKQMNRSGLLTSVRGAHGGYQLARDAREVSLAQLIEAVEGSPQLVRCASSASDDREACALIGSCPVRLPLVKVNEYFCNFLRGVSLADLAFDEDFDAQSRSGIAAKVLVQ